MSKVYAEGQLGQMISAALEGFQLAHADKQREGFDPKGAIQADSPSRVEPVFNAILNAYGDVDAKALGVVGFIGAIKIAKAAQELVQALESMHNMTPEEANEAAALLGDAA